MKNQLQAIINRILCTVLLIISLQSSAEASYTTLVMDAPVDNIIITSVFGLRTHPIYGTQKYHSGTDLGTDYNDPIRAAYPGTVAYAGWISGYGYTVIIDHGKGLTTLYAHNNALTVTEGEQVSKGQLIALSGSTGNSTGPHCHFEVRINDQPTDPALYCPALAEAYKNIGYEVLYGDGAAQDTDFIDFDPDANYLETLIGTENGEETGIIELIANTATKGLKIITTYLLNIAITLMIIDLSMSAMMRSVSQNEGDISLVKWLVAKIIYFASLLWVMQNWGQLWGNMAREYFVGAGAAILGESADEVITNITDPTMIIKEGYNLISPIILSLNTYRISLPDILTLEIFGTPLFIISIIASIAFIFIFGLIAIKIGFVYIEFYLAVLFSFTTFIWTGNRYTEQFGTRSFAPLLTSLMNLMFFCFYSVIMIVCLQSISADAIVSDTIESERGQITNVSQYMERTRDVESFGGTYDIYGSARSPADKAYHGVESYGAYQINASNWNAWCEEFINAGGSLASEGGFSNQPTGSTYPWTPENQDKVARYKMIEYYKQEGSWEGVASRWNGGGDPEYWQKLNKAPASMAPQQIINLIVIIKLLALSLLFLFLGDRISKKISDMFSNMQLYLGNPQ